MKNHLNYKGLFVIACGVALVLALISTYLFFHYVKKTPQQAATAQEKPATTSSTEVHWPAQEIPTGNGSCIFVMQPNVQTQAMVSSHDTVSLGYDITLDPSVATGTLVSACKINGMDIQLIKESPNSEPKSNWMLATKVHDAKGGWNIVRYRDTLQSDFPGCEIRQLYSQENNRFVGIKCSQETEMGNVGRWEDYYLADMKQGVVTKYASCASHDLNLQLNPPSLQMRNPLTDYIPSMRCSVVSNPLVKSNQ